MTAAELKSARHALGLSAESFARAFGVASGRTVRGWETGERNGAPATIPQPIAILVNLALDLPAVRARLGIADLRLHDLRHTTASRVTRAGELSGAGRRGRPAP